MNYMCVDNVKFLIFALSHAAFKAEQQSSNTQYTSLLFKLQIPQWIVTNWPWLTEMWMKDFMHYVVSLLQVVGKP